MRCDECKYWEQRDVHGEANRVGFGYCKGVRARWKIIEEVAPADYVGHTDDYTAAQLAALKTARAYVEDGSEYYAALITAPDFFCALFEKRD